MPTLMCKRSYEERENADCTQLDSLAAMVVIRGIDRHRPGVGGAGFRRLGRIPSKVDHRLYN